LVHRIFVSAPAKMPPARLIASNTWIANMREESPGGRHFCDTPLGLGHGNLALSLRGTPSPEGIVGFRREVYRRYLVRARQLAD
jgi:hypothetical protein